MLSTTYPFLLSIRSSEAVRPFRSERRFPIESWIGTPDNAHIPFCFLNCYHAFSIVILNRIFLVLAFRRHSVNMVLLSSPIPFHFIRLALAL